MERKQRKGTLREQRLHLICINNLSIIVVASVQTTFVTTIVQISEIRMISKERKTEKSKVHYSVIETFLNTTSTVKYAFKVRSIDANTK